MRAAELPEITPELRQEFQRTRLVPHWRFAALEDDLARLQARDRQSEEDIAAARQHQREADAARVRMAAGMVRDLLRLHHTDMNRPGGGGTQTAISQERYSVRITEALAAILEEKP